MPAAGRPASILLALALLGAGEATTGDIERPGYRLAFDDRTWAERPATPPAELVLSCLEPACSPGIAVIVLRERRPLPSPGAGPFTPGAVAGAAIALRAQDVTPGARLIADAPAEPAMIDGRPAFLQSFEVEDRDLRRSGLAAMLVPLDGETLHWRLTAPAPGPHLSARLRQLMRGLKLE